MPSWPWSVSAFQSSWTSKESHGVYQRNMSSPNLCRPYKVFEGPRIRKDIRLVQKQSDLILVSSASYRMSFLVQQASPSLKFTLGSRLN